MPRCGDLVIFVTTTDDRQTKPLPLVHAHGVINPMVLCVTCLTEAEFESGNQHEVVRLSASSSHAPSDCHGEKASPHMADKDKVCAVMTWPGDSGGSNCPPPP